MGRVNQDLKYEFARAALTFIAESSDQAEEPWQCRIARHALDELDREMEK